MSTFFYGLAAILAAANVLGYAAVSWWVIAGIVAVPLALSMIVLVGLTIFQKD